MRGALEFWLFFFEIILGALVLGVVLCGPPALLWLLAGPWAAVPAFVALLAGYITWATWDDHR